MSLRWRSLILACALVLTGTIGSPLSLTAHASDNPFLGGTSWLKLSSLSDQEAWEVLDLYYLFVIGGQQADAGSSVNAEARLKLEGITAARGEEPLAPSSVNPGLILRKGPVEVSFGSVPVSLPSHLLVSDAERNVTQMALALPAHRGDPAAAEVSVAGFQGDYEDVRFLGASGKVRLPARLELSSTILQTREEGADRDMATLGGQLTLNPGLSVALESAWSATGEASDSHARAAEVTAQAGRAYANLAYWKTDEDFRTPFLLDDLEGEGGIERARFWGSYAFNDIYSTSLYVLHHRDATAPTEEAGIVKESNTVVLSLYRHFPAWTIEGRTEWYAYDDSWAATETRARKLDLVLRPQTQFTLGVLRPWLVGEAAGGYTWEDRNSLSDPAASTTVRGPHTWATVSAILTPKHVITLRWEKYWRTSDFYKTELEYWWRF